MINSVVRFIVIIVLLILLQVLVFNNIQFSGFVNPYVYIMIILILPSVTPAWLVLIISFLTGLIIDLFSGSPGMHASATLLAGFSRPLVLRLISPRDGYESGSDLSMAAYGFRWFLIYAAIIVVIHHTALFFLEVFRLTDFFRTIFRILLSSLFTLGFILLIEYYRKGR
ncbi:MAG: rod shape-determining protein MreD [Bacteroidetes bacterium RBG_19FT_COMBO_42_7]|jgi:rod shape-determining protein MreD|nr:MAG: rod shape-determining protein MreD [Bacteroidetes bacterium RBG_13_42_15]OFY80605.1 MAG: rod shape-determining protein MreD [Bacteroidetes bacterium RBG_19FT_COMBO_42_7]